MAAARRRQVVKASRTASVNTFLGRVAHPRVRRPRCQTKIPTTPDRATARPTTMSVPVHTSSGARSTRRRPWNSTLHTPDPNTPRLSYPAER